MTGGVSRAAAAAGGLHSRKQVWVTEPSVALYCRCLGVSSSAPSLRLCHCALSSDVRRCRLAKHLCARSKTSAVEASCVARANPSDHFAVLDSFAAAKPITLCVRTGASDHCLSAAPRYGQTTPLSTFCSSLDDRLDALRSRRLPPCPLASVCAPHCTAVTPVHLRPTCLFASRPNPQEAPQPFAFSAHSLFSRLLRSK